MKKAVFQISLNTIILTLLSVIVLGLALSFVRTLFSQGQEISSKVIDSTEVNQLINPPTQDNPLTLTPAQLRMRKTQTKILDIAFMNTEDDLYNFTLSISSNEKIKFISPVQPLPLDFREIGYWKIAIDASSADEGTYSAIVKVKGYKGDELKQTRSKNIILTISS